MLTLFQFTILKCSNANKNTHILPFQRFFAYNRSFLPNLAEQTQNKPAMFFSNSVHFVYSTYWITSCIQSNTVSLLTLNSMFDSVVFILSFNTIHKLIAIISLCIFLIFKHVFLSIFLHYSNTENNKTVCWNLFLFLIFQIRFCVSVHSQCFAARLVLTRKVLYLFQSFFFLILFYFVGFFLLTTKIHLAGWM